MSTQLHRDLTGADLHVNALHADTHIVAGTDPLTLAESQITSLVTDLAAKIPKTLFDAYSILIATADDTPVALTVAAQTLVGRITGGVIAALTATDVRTLLNVADGANNYVLADKAVTLAKMADMATAKLIGRATAGAGVPELIDLSAAGAELINDADAAAQLATLGAAAAADVALNTLLALATARHGALTNLITNGEFETNITGWYSSSATLSRETGVPLVGAGSLKGLNGAGASDVCWPAEGICIVGHVYYLAALVKSTAAAGRKVLASVSHGAAATGAAVDCSSVATVILSFTATGTTAYPIFYLDSYVANEYFLLDSAVCYDLTA